MKGDDLMLSLIGMIVGTATSVFMVSYAYDYSRDIRVRIFCFCCFLDSLMLTAMFASKFFN